MKIEEYIKRLDPKKSYWWVKVREIEPLNDVRATTENLWIVFVCLKCSLEAKEPKFHAVPYTKLVKDSEGGFWMYCPKAGNIDDPIDCENYISVDWLPPVLKEIFSETTFRTVGDSCDEEEVV